MFKNIPSNSNRKWIYELTESNNLVKKLVEVFVKPKHWENSDSHVVLPFSIHSGIYNGIYGDLKIKSLLETVKSYAKNKVLILLSEGAHLHALSIKHNSYEKAFKKTKADALQLCNRFKKYFEGCEVAFWEEFIWNNPHYHLCKEKLNNTYEASEDLRAVIQSDVERLDEYFDPETIIDKKLFQEKSCLDLLEMLSGFLVLHAENYKVIIYPGSMPNAFIYLQRFTNFNATFINASIKVRDLLTPLTPLNLIT